MAYGTVLMVKLDTPEARGQLPSRHTVGEGVEMEWHVDSGYVGSIYLPTYQHYHTIIDPL
eukprot:scaffold43310_cov58-Cyclotella_meneghiniana.AAC.4